MQWDIISETISIIIYIVKIFICNGELTIAKIVSTLRNFFKNQNFLAKYRFQYRM